MTKLTGQEMPWPLVETSWLADHLEDPDLRILDCSLMMEITDRGAAASLDALALTLLGGRKVAVYHGSLTEWAADVKLPMEKDTPAASPEP